MRPPECAVSRRPSSFAATRRIIGWQAMRDYYERLGLAGPHQVQSLARVLADGSACDRDTADARAVLSDQSRKAEYDAAWRALTIVRALRARLGLVQCVHWRVETTGDFKRRLPTESAVAACFPLELGCGDAPKRAPARAQSLSESRPGLPQKPRSKPRSHS